MDIWLVVYFVLLVALCATVVGRASLGRRYPLALNGLTAVIVICCLAQWIGERSDVWTLGLGLLAVAVAVFAVVMALRDARTSERA